MKGIFINALPFPISIDLWQALLQLRLPDKVRYLWIDALCINQVDKKEKALQVGYMRTIYERASRVIVWLGEDDNMRSDLAFDLINGQTDCAKPAERPKSAEQPSSGVRQEDGEDGGRSQALEIHDFKIVLMPQQDIRWMPDESSLTAEQFKGREAAWFPKVENPLQEPWAALYALFCRAWFGRVWCLQEIAVAVEDPVIMCGNNVTTWDRLVSFVYSFSPPAGKPPSSIDHLSIWYARDTISCYVRTRNALKSNLGSWGLEALLRSTKRLKSSLPCDKVFSLLGLISNPGLLPLKPNYSVSGADVFTMTILRIIASSGILNLLCFGTNSSNEGLGCDRLPSWVPDWSLDPAQLPSPLWSPGAYHACKGMDARAQFRELPVLLVPGLPIDTITHVSKQITIDNNWQDGFASGLIEVVEDLESMLYSIMKNRMEGYTVPTHTSVIQRFWALEPHPRNSDAFWRTLLANKITPYLSAAISPVPGCYAEMYEVLHDSLCKWPRLDLDEVLGPDSPQAARLRKPTPSAVPADFEPGLPPPERLLRYCRPLIDEIAKNLDGRRLFVSKHNYLGIASHQTRVGDWISVLSGADMPFILRCREEDESLQLISEAYVHGIMNGEAVEDCGTDYRERMCIFPLR